MRTIKHYIMRLIIFLFFISFSFFAQDKEKFDFNNSTAVKDIKSDFSKNGAWVISRSTDNTIEGSVFLFSSWENSYIIESVNGRKFSINNLNYNIKTTEIEAKFSKDSLFQFNKSDIGFIHVNNKQYKIINNELYEMLFSGEKYSLFKSFKVLLRKGNLNPLTQVATADTYIKKSDYFYMLNGALLELKLKKKDILYLMNDKEKEVKVFVSKNNLSYSEEEDVVKMLKNFNY